VEAVRPLLIGEDNPYGSDPRFALYPRPTFSAGGRLCHRILRLTEKEYIRDFERVNLCGGKWSMKEARKKAEELSNTRPPDAPFVLLGTKVAKAFGARFEPFTFAAQLLGEGVHRPLIILPHPSGLNRLWNGIDSFEKAREILRRGGVLPAEAS
jgi:hypothetical protein